MLQLSSCAWITKQHKASLWRSLDQPRAQGAAQPHSRTAGRLRGLRWLAWSCPRRARTPCSASPVTPLLVLPAPPPPNHPQSTPTPPPTQLVGAILGSAFLYATVPHASQSALGSNKLQPGVTVGNAMTGEILLTFVLVGAVWAQLLGKWEACCAAWPKHPLVAQLRLASLHDFFIAASLLGYDDASGPL